METEEDKPKVVPTGYHPTMANIVDDRFHTAIEQC